MMRCRICGSQTITFVAQFKPYLDYETPVFDCSSCGCRFVPHDSRAHEMLHAKHSSYDSHARQGEVAAEFFAQAQISKLRAYLCGIEKYRFVIDFIDKRPSSIKIAEIGSSKGYLSSYFIASGKDINAFDISETAVKDANRTFGHHFHLMSDDMMQRLGNYDVIFHVGTIGCVDKPIELTHQLLSLLKPDGWLIFNAPVKEHLDALRSLWLGTPPPDLVTIFPSYFWRKTFGSTAKVDLSLSHSSLSDYFSFKRNARRPYTPSRTLLPDRPLSTPGVSRKGLKRYLRESLRWGLKHLKSPMLSPYGAFVVMQNRNQ